MKHFLIKKFLIFFALLATFISSIQARLLSSDEMRAFITENRVDVEHVRKTQGLHIGYAVVEVAKQKMLKIESLEKSECEQEMSRYRDVILSALNGIGVGGMSRTKKANAGEKRMAYLALYAIGFNAKDVPSCQLSVASVTTQPYKKHLSACNELVALSYQIRNKPPRSREAQKLAGLVDRTRTELNRIPGKPQTYKAYSATDFELTGTLGKKYQLFGIVLSFEETARKLLRGKTICSAEVIIEYNALRTQPCYQTLTTTLGLEAAHMRVIDPLRAVTLTNDKITARKAILGSLASKPSLGQLVDVSSNSTFSLKKTARRETRQLTLLVHTDKTAQYRFQCCEDVGKSFLNLFKDLDEIKEITVSFDDLSRLF